MNHFVLRSSLCLLLVSAGLASELTDKVSAAATQSELAVEGQEKWLFLKQEMAHLAKGALTAEAVAPAVQAISSYQTALAAEGVQLVVLPVPAKAEIYPDKLSAGAAPQELAGRQAEFIKALEAAKVDVVDLAAAFHTRRLKDPQTLLYCQRDAHWSPAGLRLAATLVQAKIKDSSWFKPAVALGEDESLKITGDLMTTPATEALGPEMILLQRTKEIVPPSADGAAILLGDSHTLIFSGGANGGFHCQGGGLLDVLQAATGQPWMQVANAGGGTDAARAQLARKAIAKPDFWKSKKLVVWCFSIREVTEKEWSAVPIKR
jgi:alginate O-acetyltransferase complex protein AlgJ